MMDKIGEDLYNGMVDCHERNDVDGFYRCLERFDRHMNQINGTEDLVYNLSGDPINELW